MNPPRAHPAMLGHRKPLPVKICAHCGLPMTWRKRWERTWDNVRHCSDRCRGESRRAR